MNAHLDESTGLTQSSPAPLPIRAVLRKHTRVSTIIMMRHLLGEQVRPSGSVCDGIAQPVTVMLQVHEDSVSPSHSSKHEC